MTDIEEILIMNAALCGKLHNYMRALDIIEKILNNASKEAQTNNAKWLQQYYLARFCEIRSTIDEAKSDK